MTIRNLLNGTKYQIILKADSSYEVESVGVVRLGSSPVYPADAPCYNRCPIHPNDSVGVAALTGVEVAP